MKVMIVLLTLLLFVACTEQQKNNAPLTEEQKLNLQLAQNDNVPSYGAPPMIPKDHPVVVGDDVSEFQNGGEACLECHSSADEEDAPQTEHPERNNCLQCHLPIVDESATDKDFKVDNTFIKHIPSSN